MKIHKCRSLQTFASLIRRKIPRQKIVRFKFCADGKCLFTAAYIGHKTIYQVSLPCQRPGRPSLTYSKVSDMIAVLGFCPSDGIWTEADFKTALLDL